MLARLIGFSLTQRLLVLVLTALLIGAGTLAFRQLPIDAFPDVSTTQVKIIVKAAGMTPEEVEARITVPIEQELLGIPRQRVLRTVSKYSLTDVTLDFEDGTDLYWARQQVAERLGNVMKDLPAQASGGLAPITTPLGEMYMFTIEGPLSLEEKRSLLDWTIRPQLRTLRGVADVNSLGGHARSFEVVPDNAALNARGLTLDQLKQALESNNRNDGSGRLSEGEETLLVRVEGAIRSLDDLRAVVVSNKGGAVVRVGDVAAVNIGSLTRYGAVSKDGQGEAVEGLVLGLRGANAQLVVNAVRAKLAEIAPLLPAGTRIVPLYDRGSLVERAVGTVTRALGEAIVLVLILLLAFLGNLRAAIVVATILPLSALFTFILMNSFGLSANLMSLGGLAIAIGMLVDAAVVIIENVESGLAQAGAAQKLPLLHVIYRAVREVAAPVVSGILIITIVFIPLLTLEGLEGKLFIPVALTIVFALVGSLILSLTAIPVFASLLMKRAGVGAVHHEPWLVRKLNALYAPSLDWALANTRTVIVAALLLLATASGAYLLLGKTFMPTMDEGDMVMQLEKLPSISLDQTLELDLRVQRALLERVPEVKQIVARSGADELGLDPMGLNQTDTFLVLKPIAEWRTPSKEWLADQLRAVMQDFPGITYSFTQPIEMRVAEMLTGVRGDIAVKVFGPDLDELARLAAEIETLLKNTRGSEDAFTLKNDGVQYLRVEVDRLAAGRLGFNIEALQSSLKSLVEGQPVGLVVEPGRRTPIVLRGGDGNNGVRDSVERFSELRIALPGDNAGGKTVPLAELARIERLEGPVKVDRENAQRYVVIQSNVRGRDLVGFVEEAKLGVAAKLQIPPGYRLVWGGQFENQQRAAQRLSIVVPVALALIFLILFSTFGSIRQAALVLSNVPFALVGGIFALLASGEYLSVPASVGFIALLGIAVLNGVVMVTYFNQLRAQGLPLAQVVVDGAKRRLRPVMMTASIAAFGLLPLLFASGPGSEIQRPLAIVVIGGLVTSTLLTLLLLPILYRHFEARPKDKS
jgi:cobalt-zinc-cadmium resistance protein CzcA